MTDEELGRAFRELASRTTFVIVKLAGGKTWIRAIGDDALSPFREDATLDDALARVLSGLPAPGGK